MLETVKSGFEVRVDMVADLINQILVGVIPAERAKGTTVNYKGKGDILQRRYYRGSGLKILTNKQVLNPLPILLAQIQAGNNLNKLKNEARQILYSLYRLKVLTKTVCNKLIKAIRA